MSSIPCHCIWWPPPPWPARGNSSASPFQSWHCWTQVRCNGMVSWVSNRSAKKYSCEACYGYVQQVLKTKLVHNLAFFCNFLCEDVQGKILAITFDSVNTLWKFSVLHKNILWKVCKIPEKISFGRIIGLDLALATVRFLLQCMPKCEIYLLYFTKTVSQLRQKWACNMEK